MVKKLLESVREYKKDSLLAPLFVTLEVVMEVIIPLLMAKLIDKGIDAGNMGEIWRTGGVLALCCVVSLLFGALSGGFAAKASAGFAANLRHDMYYNVQKFSFANIDKFSTASLVTRLTTDVTNIQMAYQMIVRIAVRAPVMMVFALVMAFSINSDIALVFLCAVPILGIGLYLIMSGAHPIFNRVFKTYDKLNKVVQENLRGVRVVKAFVREEHEKEKFGEVSESIYEDFSKAEKLLAFNGPLMQFCMYGCMLLSGWIGARLIVAGSMTTGELMSIITYIMQILMSLMMLSMVFVMITISRASAERVSEVLGEKSDITNCADPVFEIKDGSVRFAHVDFSYAKEQKKLCLSDVNIDIRAGETVGILGGTGAGKTTLIQLIPRLYDVTAGTLYVGGRDVRDYDIEALRDAVSVVLQKNTLFSGSIKENLRWGKADATDEEIERACRLACAHEFIQSFPEGYDTHIEQGGSNVSGGQRQRLCIARALLKEPKILILDDSTSAVDTATDARIRKAFKEELPHMTKLIIAQRVSSVQNADKIIVMENGRVDGFGTHEQLLKYNSIYRDVFSSQMKGGDFDEQR